jgi:DNA ligase (NAD+)
VCEFKYDGLAVSLHYKNGRFVRALTRGDGIKGEDVTANVQRYVNNIPFVLPESFRQMSRVSGEFEVRGEVVISRSEFARINTEAQQQRRSGIYSNPRYVTSACSVSSLSLSLSFVNEIHTVKTIFHSFTF